jgi:hypothetical protein
MRPIRDRINDIAFCIDEYCCDKSINNVTQPYNIFRLLQIKLILKIQRIAQRILYS